MRERRLIAIVVLCCAVIAVVLLFPQLSSAQNGGFGLKGGDPDTPPDFTVGLEFRDSAGPA